MIADLQGILPGRLSEGDRDRSAVYRDIPHLAGKSTSDAFLDACATMDTAKGINSFPRNNRIDRADGSSLAGFALQAGFRSIGNYRVGSVPYFTVVRRGEGGPVQNIGYGEGDHGIGDQETPEDSVIKHWYRDGN